MKAAELRDHPYPYKAMLAICSDLDETPDGERYFEIARFLNTRAETAAGRGVGLEVGNTIYFDMPDDQFAYWNTDDAGREMVRRLILSGHIDCFHSFGDLAASRAHAERALDELSRHGCKIECWVDHATAPTNLGADIMRGSGDVRGAPAYHADLTYAHGVRFVWCGRVTSVIGQNRSPSLGGLFSIREPIDSVRTIVTEAAKSALGWVGNKKFRMHAENDLVRRKTLRDGHGVFEFMRCNPHWRGVAAGATSDGIAEVLTERVLRRLIERRGACALYTHLGKTRHRDSIFAPATIAAFRRLAVAAEQKNLLVTTTRRLLGYSVTRQHVDICVLRGAFGETVQIGTSELDRQNMPRDLSGLTVYVNNARKARVEVDGLEEVDIQRNPPDSSGRESVSFHWNKLVFPA